MNKMSQEQIDDDVSHTFPPEVKDLPDTGIFVFGDNGFKIVGPYNLFAEELELAAELVYEDGDTRLLDALRQKWPEAVEEGWPKASEAALRELSIDEPAAIAAMA